MSKTPFSKKCEVLGELWLYYREEAPQHEEWAQFFEWADIALPLAYLSWQDLATVKTDAKRYINDAWVTFCEMISIDPDQEYDGIEDAWSASPNPPYVDVSVKNIKM